MDTYEKKYKEIVGQIKKVYLYAQTDSTKAVLEEIFPELKESEDERIKEAIIATIHLYYGEPLEDEAKEMLAWLEKQGEKKPQRMISAEAKEAMYDKPAWSEEDEDFMYDTLSNLTELKDRYGEGYGNVGKCIDWLKSLKQRIGG